MRKLTRPRRQQGYILFWAIIMVTLMAMGGYAVTRIGYLEGVLASNDVNQVKALNIAEAGLDRALVELAFNTSWNAGFSNQPLDTGTFSVAVAPVAGKPEVTVTSTGTVNGYSKTLTMSVYVGQWPYAMYAFGIFWGNPSDSAVTLQIDNNANIDGNVFGYGNVNVNNNAAITGGDLAATGTITGGGSYTKGPVPNPPPQPVTLDTTYYRSQIALAAAQAPTGWGLKNNKTYSLAGTTLYVNGSVNISNNDTITGPGAIVATGDITVGNNTQVIDSGVNMISGGNLTFSNNVNYVGQGNILYGQTSVTLQQNSSGGSSLFILSPGTVDITQNGNVSGMVWGGTVTLSQNAEVDGTVYGQQFTSNQIYNNFDFIQNPPVGTPPPPGITAAVQVISWQESPGVW